METIINEILNEMEDFLSIEQQKKLQQVLLKKLSESRPIHKAATNEQYKQMYLDAKKIEGCSARTIDYYDVTLKTFLVL